MGTIEERIAHIRQRIDRAAERAGRAPEDVTLIAVSKRKPVPDIRAAQAAGQAHFGENYVQHMLAKASELAGSSPEPQWHYIGPLQRNKARHVVGRVALLHGVDNVRLLDELERRGAAADVVTPVLIQVNLTGEETKSGCTEDELPALVAHAAGLQHVALRGLMTMPRFCPDPEDVRPVFRRLREVRDGLVAAGAATAEALSALSMGMSHDFEVAVEEGATLVRVGSAIFGARPAPTYPVQ